MGLDQSKTITKLKTENALLKKENSALRSINIDKTILQSIGLAWSHYDYRYLVFSGGGVKAFAYNGALGSLDKKEILYDDNGNLKIKGIAGTSAGAIVAGLIAIGYKPAELLDIMKHLNFNKLFHDDNGPITDAYDFITSYGLCKGQTLIDLLGKLIRDKTGNEDYTLEDLYREKGITLVTVTTNLNCSCSIYMYPGNPIKQYSNVAIKDAIRMSAGIPFAFEPITYNGDLFVDGGVLDDYPIHVFDGKFPGDPEARLNLCPPNPYVLGLKIMPNNELLNYQLAERCNISGFYEYVDSFINTCLIDGDRRVMIPSFWLRSIIIITPNYSITKDNLTIEQEKQLIELGIQYTNDFFMKSKADRLLH